MSEKNLRRLKRIVYGLIALFILLMLSSFVPFWVNLIYLFIFLYFIFGVSLIVLTLKSEVDRKLRVFLLLTGFSSIGFAASIINGFLAMSGFYTFPEVLYFISTLAPMAGFIIGAIGSIVLFRKGGRHSYPGEFYEISPESN